MSLLLFPAPTERFLEIYWCQFWCHHLVAAGRCEQAGAMSPQHPPWGKKLCFILGNSWRGIPGLP